MNSFPPMLAFPWILGRAIRRAEATYGVVAVHVRTQCTHHNLSDAFSKPYAWWHRNLAGEVVKTSIFSRKRALKHDAVLFKETPSLIGEALHRTDHDALELAQNYAYFSIIYRMHLERIAGFHMPHRAVEIPIDLLNRFMINETGLLQWFDLIAASGTSLRIERPDGRLSKMTRHDAESAARLGEDRFQLAVIATNTVNIFQAYLLGISLMLGGRRMAKYVPGMNRDIQKFALHRDEWKYHEPAFLPFTAIPVSEALKLVDEADRCQAEFGFRTSLPLVASAWEGQAAARLDSLLSMDFKLLFDEDLV